MSIKRVPNREDNLKIGRLNDLINQYNKMESPPRAKSLLQKIDAMRNQLYTDNELRENNEFMKWYFTDPIRNEITHNNLGKDRDQIFVEDSKLQIKNLTLHNWKKMTNPLMGSRSENYCKMDHLIHDVEAASQNMNQQPSPKALSHLKNTLEVLQQQTLFMINNNIQHNKPNMQRNFEYLLDTTNNLLNVTNQFSRKFITQSPDKIRTIGHTCTPLIESLIAGNNDAQQETIRNLSRSTEQQLLNGFNVTFLGGGNNRNWRAENPETGAQFVIRVEKADDPNTDYSIVNEIKNDETIKNNLAQDYFYYPARLLGQDKRFGDRDINVAISEFCPNGDLFNHLLRKIERNPGQEHSLRSSDTLDAIEQVAKIASDFNQRNLGYMDIKATNFLKRSTGEVITADVKSVVRTEEDNRVRLSDISTTISPPEYYHGKESSVNANSYMAYQIGLMAYDLMVSTREHNAQEDLFALLNNRSSLDNNLPLNFDLPVFNTPAGKEIKVFIQTMLEPKPESRLSLEQIQPLAHSLRVQHGFVAEVDKDADHQLEPSALNMA